MSGLKISQFFGRLLTGRENTAVSTLLWENQHRLFVRIIMALIRLWDRDHFHIYETDPRFKETENGRS